MALSRRQDVIVAFFERLEAIKIADGFNTDAATALFLGVEPLLGPDDPSYAIALVIGDDDAPRYQGEKTTYNLPLECRALAKVDPATPDAAWMTVEALLQDIKRAIELPSLEERRLNRLLVGNGLERGRTVTLQREPGSLSVGASLTYSAPISEKWGEP